MITWVICNPDGSIYSVRQEDKIPEGDELALVLPEGCFYIDITGQEPFDSMDILDIHNGYKADAKKKKLIKIN